MQRLRWSLAAVFLVAVSVANAQSASREDLGRKVMAIVAEPAVSRAHWGLMVAGMDGTRLFSLNEGQFFQPASNLKLFTTAAAMAILGAERTFETKVVGRGMFSGEKGATKLTGDLLLVGGGDANLSGRELPYVSPVKRAVPKVASATAQEPEPLRYLEAMADDVAATGLTSVTGDVVGDDTLFPYEPYPQDWAMDDAVWGYGAPVSALSVGDNEMRLTITPAPISGQPAMVELLQAFPYYTVETNVRTAPVKGAISGVQVERAPGSKLLRVYGQIAADAGPDVEEVAIQDPAEYASMAFRAMLERRGVHVAGKVRVSHVPVTEARGFLALSKEPLSAAGSAAESRATMTACMDCGTQKDFEQRVLSVHRSPSLGEDVVVTNKVSQNLHAELLLHHLGLTQGLDGSGAAGARVIRDFLVTRVGIDPEDFVMYDGSGLSGHDLLTPRAMVRLLTWASTQPWFAGWRASLPVGGEDGSLRARFGKGPLMGKVFAKTGTLGEARALSGYVICASGRTVAFSVMVTDHAPGGHADQEAMDRIVGEIAAAE